MTQAVEQGGAKREDWGIDEAPLLDDPLLECLVLLSRRYSRPQSRESLTAGLPLVNHRLTPSLLPRAAKRAGLYTRLVRRAPESIPSPLLPAILLLRNKGACLLMGWDEDGRARLRFPGTGDTEIPLTRDELMHLYTGIAIYVRPKFRFDARAPETGKLRVRHWFWGALYEARHLYRDVLVVAFLVNLLALAMPLFTMNVYDRVVPNKAFETLWVLAVGVFLVLLFDFLLKNLRAYVLELASKRIDGQLSSLIMERILGLRLEARPASVGSFASNVRAFEGVRDFIASASVTTLIDVPFILIFLLVLILIAWPLVLPALVSIVIVVSYSLWMRLRMEALADSSLRAASLRNATLIESLTGLEVVKALNAGGEMQRRWEHATGFIAHVNGKLRLLSSTTLSFTALIQQLTSVAVLVTGVYLVADGEASMGGLIAAMMLAGRGIAPLGAIAGLLTQYHNARTALAAMDQLMSLPVERPAEQSFLARHEFKGGIEFREVGFAYPGREQPSLRRVSFSIKPGEKVAVLGRVGSGKTTLERLILGLYQPTEGAVYLDGADARQLDPAELRRAVGYVPQDTTLFFGSLRDNLTLGAPEIGDKRILEAAALAGVTEFANRHPLGFDMPIGERGESLSTGQRQAVVIARALLLKPPILIMDEPTAHMDFASEAAFKQRLKAFLGQRTLLLVTHRTALLECVDRLIVLDQGQIIADGPRDAIMQSLREGKIKGAGT
ncbi:MAG: type I secretion system permease/ATPase [Gammaproteobacteria bacterium]|nr:type I secretion system permease/ATPase [Gammaproteobacteria bacterium]